MRGEAGERRVRPGRATETGATDDGADRLQKVLARAGFGSRRFSETLITEGRVTVDGVTVRELGVRVDPHRQKVAVDGEAIKLPRRNVYLAVYKPRGVLSDAGSPDDEVPTVLEMAPPDLGHLFPIGRLDLRSEGLVLLTSDGEVTHRLTHPSFAHAKVYYVLVEKRPSETELIRLRSGIELEDGMTAPARVEVVDQLPAELKLDTGPQRGIWLRFELTEGKKRQLRYMTAAVGLPTLRLVRWAIGPLALRDMAPGSVRYLTAAEVQKLRLYAGLEAGPVGGFQDGRTGRPGRSDGGRRGQRERRSAPGRTPRTAKESGPASRRSDTRQGSQGPGKPGGVRGPSGKPGGRPPGGARGNPRGNPRSGGPRGGRR